MECPFERTTEHEQIADEPQKHVEEQFPTEDLPIPVVGEKPGPKDEAQAEVPFDAILEDIVSEREAVTAGGGPAGGPVYVGPFPADSPWPQPPWPWGPGAQPEGGEATGGLAGQPEPAPVTPGAGQSPAGAGAEPGPGPWDPTRSAPISSPVGAQLASQTHVRDISSTQAVGSGASATTAPSGRVATGSGSGALMAEINDVSNVISRAPTLPGALGAGRQNRGAASVGARSLAPFTGPVEGGPSAGEIIGMVVGRAEQVVVDSLATAWQPWAAAAGAAAIGAGYATVRGMRGGGRPRGGVPAGGGRHYQAAFQRPARVYHRAVQENVIEAVRPQPDPQRPQQAPPGVYH